MALLSEREDINSSETPSNLTIRQHAWRMGPCECVFERPYIPGHQLALSFAYYHFVVPHRGLRQRLAHPLPTKGSGSLKRWGAAHPRHGSRCNRPHLDHGQTP